MRFFFVFVILFQLCSKNVAHEQGELIVKEYKISRRGIELNFSNEKVSRHLSPKEGQKAPVLFEANIAGSTIALELNPVEFSPIFNNKESPLRVPISTFLDETGENMLTISEDGRIRGHLLVNGEEKLIDSVESSGKYHLSLKTHPSPFNSDSAMLRGGRSLRERRRQLRLRPWGCISKPHSLEIGIVIGSNLRNRFNNKEGDIENYLGNMLQEVNIILGQQLNILLTLSSENIIYWDKFNQYDNAECGKSVAQMLSDFSDWNPPRKSGIWYLLDDCPIVRVSGQAMIGTVCNPDQRWNRGVSLIGQRQTVWLTFVHEIGHILGAMHPSRGFGGIMDYGDKLLEGQYQFNEENSKSAMCKRVNEIMGTCEYLKPAEPKCGNGILEPGEECDCGENKCEHCDSLCHLKDDAECEPSTETCCTEGGRYAAANVMCTTATGSIGHCSAGGRCRDSACDDQNIFGDYCGTHNDNDCKFKCKYNGKCSRLDGFVYSDGHSFNEFKDSEMMPCRIRESGKVVGMGICRNGMCDGNSTPPLGNDATGTAAPIPSSKTPNPTPSPVSEEIGPGIRVETWYDVEAETVEEFRESELYKHFPPDEIDYRKDFLAQKYTKDKDSFGARISATLHPPSDGKYRFYVACDDACELYISGKGLPNGQIIAFLDSKVGKKKFEKKEIQESESYYLKKGEEYQLILLHVRYKKGNFHAAAGWITPDTSKPKVIPEEVLTSKYVS